MNITGAAGESINFTLKWEGGISRDPLDPGNKNGGITAYGVTQPTYNEWRRIQNLPLQSVGKITPDETEALYTELYFKPVGGEHLPKKLATVLFDTAVNVGTHRAVSFLQKAVNSKQDGIFGPKTLAKTEAIPEREVIKRVLTERRDFYQTLGNNPKYKRYLRGWLNRVADLEKYALPHH